MEKQRLWWKTVQQNIRHNIQLQFIFIDDSNKKYYMTHLFYPPGILLQ